MRTVIPVAEGGSAGERTTPPEGRVAERTGDVCSLSGQVLAEAQRARAAARASRIEARRCRLESIQIRFAVGRSRDMRIGPIWAMSTAGPASGDGRSADVPATEAPTAENVSAVLEAVGWAHQALQDLSGGPDGINPQQFATARVAAAILSEAVDLMVRGTADPGLACGAPAPLPSTAAKLRYRALALSLWQRTPDPAVRETIEVGLYGTPDTERAREEAERLAGLAAHWNGRDSGPR